MADYRFVTRWSIDAPIEAVVAVLEDVPRWPSWWKAVVAVEVMGSGDAEGIGAVARTTWRTPLGYGLSFDARLIERTSPERLEIESTGELLGQGRWELSHDAGRTLIVFFWNVTTTRRWMNLMAPVLRPAFQWNHAVVMRQGGRGLARLLAARFEDRS